MEEYKAAMRARHAINAASSATNEALPSVDEGGLGATGLREDAQADVVEDQPVRAPPVNVPEGHIHDEITGQVRRADAQGPMMRLNDFGDGGAPLPGMGPAGMGFPGFRPDMGFPGEPLPPRFPGGGAPGGPPQLPQGLEQALTPSQRQLLMEAMAEMGGGPPGFGGGPGGGFPGGGFPGGPGGRFPGGPGGGFPGGGFPGGGFPGFGGGGAGNPFGPSFGEDEGTPSNWDPRNARMTAEEEAIARRQAAELRARAAGQQPPAPGAGGAAAAPSTGAGGTGAAAEVGRGSGAAAGLALGGGPQSLREEALNEQGLDGYGGEAGGGGMPPHVRAHLQQMQGIRREWGPPGAMGGLDRDEDMTYERLSALTERIGK